MLCCLFWKNLWMRKLFSWLIFGRKLRCTFCRKPVAAVLSKTKDCRFFLIAWKKRFEPQDASKTPNLNYVAFFSFGKLMIVKINIAKGVDVSPAICHKLTMIMHRQTYPMKVWGHLIVAKIEKSIFVEVSILWKFGKGSKISNFGEFKNKRKAFKNASFVVERFFVLICSYLSFNWSGVRAFSKIEWVTKC